MSSRKGDNQKKGQKHQNRQVYHTRFNDKASKLKDITPMDRLCDRCYEQINWKLKFNKYKPLTATAKCHKCHNKNIIKAYRQCCDKCSDLLQICSKCMEMKDIKIQSDGQKMDKEMTDRMNNEMKKMRERTKKRLKRLLDKDEITFNGLIFVYKESGEKVEDIQYKRNMLDEDEDDHDDVISEENDYDFEDQPKKCEDF